jgi:hypothetical protein
MSQQWEPTKALPTNRPLSDAEIAIAVAQAILYDRQNPGQKLPFQPDTSSLLARLGVGDRSDEDKEWRQRFFKINQTPDLGFRLAEYCWRLAGLGYLVPKLGGGGQWGQFIPTDRGHAFLQGFDPVALTHGGLDEKLAAIGLEPHELPRQYARLAQDCFLAGHFESSIVMLGVASEDLVKTLAEALSGMPSTVVHSLKKRSTRATANQNLDWITEVLAMHKSQIRSALHAKGLDADWIDSLSSVLNGSGQAIRLTRNEVGHPTGITVHQDDALQLIVLFPRLAGACRQASTTLTQL